MKTRNRRAATAIPALLPLHALIATAIHAQTPPPTTEDKPRDRVERVVVTGSNIKRTDFEGPLPVTILTAEDLAKSGVGTVAEALRKVTANSTGRVEERNAIGGLGAGGAGASLRGLGLNATLLLVNGRRTTHYAFPGGGGASFSNLNEIPVAAIERIEVLGDGASAIYGSDAIAGVINVITRRDYQGAQVTARAGDSQEGGGAQTSVNGLIGFGNPVSDKRNLLVSLDYYKLQSLNGTDRGYLSNSNLSTSGGYDRRLIFSTPANAISLVTGQYLPVPNCPAESRRGVQCVADFAPLVTRIPSSERMNVHALGSMDLASGQTVFGEASHSKIVTESRVSPDLASGNLSLQTGLPNNPFGVPVAIVGLFPELGPRHFTTDSATSRLLAGVRGAVRDIDYDAAIGWSRNEISDTLRNQIRRSAMQSALAAGTFFPFDPARTSAAVADSVKGTAVREAESSNRFVDLRLSGQVTQLPAGPLNVAGGFDYRKESLSDKSDPATSTFLNGVDYGTIDGDRSATAFFLEASVPLWRGLETQIAVRRDRYSDFGSATSPKLALAWRPVKGLLLRASGGDGFRAPTLAQIYLGTQNAFANGLIDPRRCPVTRTPTDCGGTSARSITGGNPNLVAEESRSYSTGILWEPVDRWSLGVDYYRIEYSNRIATLGATTILAQESGFPGAVVRNAATAADIAAGIPGTINTINDRYINVGFTQVSGFDLSMNGQSRVNGFDIQLRALATYQQNKRIRSTPAATLNQLAGSFEEPRWRANGAVDVRHGRWEGTFGARYVGSFRDASNTPPPENAVRKVGAELLYDTQLRYRFGEGRVVRFGINNVFDKEAPLSLATLTGQTAFADILGRYFYVELAYRFR
ncbi:MAG: TonB-dependent receptor [Betaproteobacteria bacterium]|nr:TonB-dependent receptor [Betaproteobacteria bacterium]